MHPTRTRPVMTASRLRARAGLGLCVLALAGCTNPLGPMDSDYGKHPPLQRLRAVETLDREKYARPPKELPPLPQPGERYSSRFENLPAVDMSIEDARAAVLENNLDLKVRLVDPTIQNERLRQEEAKFEAVFRPSFSYQDSNVRTTTVTVPTGQNVVNLGAGVDVPLRTGGRVSVDLTEQRTQRSANSFFTSDQTFETAAVFSLSQPLLRNAGRRANTYSIRIASLDRDISETRVKLEVIRQLASADRAYWRLFAARASLEVRQRQYELALAQLERAQRRVDAGDAPQLEVTRARAGAASQLDSIIQAERGVLDAQREFKALANIKGLDVSSSSLVRTTTPPDPVRYVFNAAELSQTALATRMEMLELELQLAQDFSSIEFAKNQALPLFTLDYSYTIPGIGTSFTASTNRFGGARDFDWRVAVSGSIPIGNEAAKARVQQAILTRLQRLSTREARELSIRSEVLGAVDKLESAYNSILASRQSVILAAATLEGEQRQFDAGARTSTDVLDAAARLADEQTKEVRALSDYQIAQVDLAFATGTMLGAARVSWAPGDPRAGQPAGGDPTPFSWPFYADPEGKRTPAQAEQERNAPTHP